MKGHKGIGFSCGYFGIGASLVCLDGERWIKQMPYKVYGGRFWEAAKIRCFAIHPWGFEVPALASAAKEGREPWHNWDTWTKAIARRQYHGLSDFKIPNVYNRSLTMEKCVACGEGQVAEKVKDVTIQVDGKEAVLQDWKGEECDKCGEFFVDANESARYLDLAKALKGEATTNCQPSPTP